ncbi:hypothetical protein F3N42_04015 [Marinihelvus fidelis]|uniref:Uncharacterized protein n=1 Tax=Marinihelvus fidelis TaxID=2613842 RepID=A0A5N0TEQ8_9GAMM|nr:hypothetical protein [Marinihelvus fidelis]KAA9133522.1 hypothetical protein F3N42_04015 [Marinihelvus fidelis]
MKRMLLCMGLALASGSVVAASADSDFQVEASEFLGGIMLQSSRADVDLDVTLVAPDGTRAKERYPSNEPVFLDVADRSLPDGLYRYEVRPVAAVKRSPSEVPANLRGLVSTGAPELAAVSGTFRVVNGEIVNASEAEDKGDLK